MPREEHRSNRTGWLRAAVLGANDGLISTAGLVMGVAAAHQSRQALVLAGLAGLVAGALSMAAGEYVSVSSQADAERADLELERREIRSAPEAERDELARIYESRGLTSELAGKVADELMSHDALSAHARDELGIEERTRARPIQAALASAGAFTGGAAPPVIIVAFLPMAILTRSVVVVTLGLLLLLGGIAAQLGGAPRLRGSLRVAFWGAAAMACTALIGHWVGAPTA